MTNELTVGEMTAVSPIAAREFATDVVRRLRAAGFEAVWAGGCVRDQLLGREPKDYDVATNAAPDEVRQIFGRSRTLAIGESFGVITLLGPKIAGQVEIATFRQDAEYSDGRHPDEVNFSNAENDAQRRDFTMNGLFYDPLEQLVIDYVDGQPDIERKLVRAIGDPRQRIAEDKLRMLRAVRFAATFCFELDADTAAAIRQHAHEINVVSAERIASEMRRILMHPTRRRGVELLSHVGLLAAILPEASRWCAVRNEETEAWLQIQHALGEAPFPLALAALLWPLAHEDAHVVGQVSRRWRLSNDEAQSASWILAHEETLRNARQVKWPRLQRILISAHTADGLKLATAVESELTGDTPGTDLCRERLQLDSAVLNPPPLLTGDDLIAHGIRPGRDFKILLDAVRDSQLNQEISSRDDAIQLVDRLRSS